MSGLEAIKSLSLFGTVKLYCKKQEQKYILLRDLASQYKERLFIYSHKVLDDMRITYEEVQTAIQIYGEYKSKRDKLLDQPSALELRVINERSESNNINMFEKIIKESKLSHSEKEKLRKEVIQKDLREKLGLVEKPKEYAATVNLQTNSQPSAPPYDGQRPAGFQPST